jgi:predicted permease
MPEFQNIPILAGEQIVYAADFTPSPILRSNKSGLVITQQRIAVLHPQYVFLFFKVGHVLASSPIQTICEVSVGRQLSRHHLRRAMYAAFVGLFLMFSAATGGMLGLGFGAISVLMAFALFGVAAFQLWLARRLGLTVRNWGGGTLEVGVDPSEYQAMQIAAEAVQQVMLARR